MPGTELVPAGQRELELSPEVFEFLSDLRKEEVELLVYGIRAMRAFIIVGKAVKWLIATLVGGFVASIALWQAILWLLERAR